VAGPYASEPQELVFTDTVDVFDAVEFSTGQLPSGSPVMFEFKLVSAGGLDFEMEAVSDLTWPPALTQSVDGAPEGGWVSFLTDLRLEAWVYIDAFGYQWQDRVWSDGLYLLDEATFEPLLLAGGAVPSITLESDGLGIDTIQYDIALFTGVSLALTLDAFPRAAATMSGTNVETAAADEPDDILATIEFDDTTMAFAIPEDEPGVLDLISTWNGHLTSSLAVVFQPAAALSTPIGSFDLVSFQIPVTLVSYDQDRAIEVAYWHPLPALAVPFANHDFGEQEVEALGNLQVPLLNEGRLDLEGTARIEGDAAFTVYPTAFYAAPGIEDGVVVTYTPGDDGDHTAILVLESNDPRNPLLEIPLRGGAFVDTDTFDTETPRVAVEGCGCASEGTGASFLGALAGLALLRRRRP
jgi:MYXO-CTERM domain-containing protein